jgi:predicted RNA binding protein YcfA (HicA-like mRNA interferase family)
VLAALRRAGFVDAPKRGKGSHTALVRVDDDGRKYLVIVPASDPIPVGTLSAILRQAGVTRDEFVDLL